MINVSLEQFEISLLVIDLIELECFMGCIVKLYQKEEHLQIYRIIVYNMESKLDILTEKIFGTFLLIYKYLRCLKLPP